MSDSKNSISSYLQLRQSTDRPNKLVNDRADFVIHESASRWNVNGTVFYDASAAARAIAKWGSKK